MSGLDAANGVRPDVPQGAPGGSGEVRDAFSIARIREHAFRELRANFVAINDKENLLRRVEIGQFSVAIQGPKGFGMNAENLGKRGVIVGLSLGAARNLRKFVSTHYVPNAEPWAGTFTTRKNWSHRQFKKVHLAFARKLRARGIAGTYRLQTQERGAPHGHAPLWLPVGVEPSELAAMWLEVTGEAGDPAARKHAVKLKPLQDEGWLLYQAQHDSRECDHQNRYEGKAWGIWNRELFVKREPLWAGEMDERQRTQFLRFLSRFARSQKYGRLLRERAEAEKRMPSGPISLEQFVKNDDQGRPIGVGLRISQVAPGSRRSGFLVRDPVIRPKVRRKHAGNLFELVPGPLIERLARGVISGEFRPVVEQPF